MTALLLLSLSTILAILYAWSALRGEERRQEWRRSSRAAWIKG